MKQSQSFTVDEQILKALGARTLKIIRTKGMQMENKITSKLEELESAVLEGYSHDKNVTVKINGNHTILAINLDPAYSDWASQEQTCTLITEAINDAIYKVDLIIEAAISGIKYESFAEVMKEIPQE